MPSFVSEDSFSGIEPVAHLATGREAPVLRFHADAPRDLSDTGNAMPDRERVFVVLGRARERPAAPPEGGLHEVGGVEEGA